MKPIRVVAAVIEVAGEWLVCRRPPEKRHGGLWEFPGGKIEAGESASDALRRELHEELHLRLVSEEPLAFTQVDSGGQFQIEFYPVRVAGRPICREHSQLAWVSVDRLLDLELAPSDRAFAETLVESSMR